MVYDFSKIIQDLDEKNVANPFEDDAKNEIWSVQQACISAILLPTPGGKDSGEFKFTCFELASKMKACDATVVDLTVDEAKKIKDAVGRCFGSVVVGFIWKILDGE